jgi:hypothetical protein
MLFTLDRPVQAAYLYSSAQLSGSVPLRSENFFDDTHTSKVKVLLREGYDKLVIVTLIV